MELLLEVPVQPFIYVGHHKQAIHYEGKNFLCKNCGRLGHIAQKCSFIIQKNRDRNNEDTSKELSTITNDGEKEQWTTISFSKGRHQGAKGPQKQPIANPIKQTNGPGISVKLFNANTGKYLDTQLLQYKSKDHRNTTPSPHTNNLQSSTFLIGDQNKLTTKNNFSILSEEPLVLNKNTKEINNQKIIINKSHASEQMSQTTNDIDMLDTIVSSITNPTNQLVKVAMQNNVHNDPTTPIKNHSTTNNTTLSSGQISNNLSTNHNLKSKNFHQDLLIHKGLSMLDKWQ